MIRRRRFELARSSPANNVAKRIADRASFGRFQIENFKFQTAIVFKRFHWNGLYIKNKF
jgi:hypothetical protein